ncbi:MAG: BLUF domain-containing protein [Pseudomonadota bacterium]
MNRLEGEAGGDSLHLILYVSSAPHLVDEDSLLEILKTSRRNNLERAITGILLYVEGNYMQVLEGPREAVLDLKETIYRDPRHHTVIEILNLPVGERIFAEWSMGFRRADRTELDDSGMNRFLQTRPSVEKTDPSALRILKSFGNSMR